MNKPQTKFVKAAIEKFGLKDVKKSILVSLANDISIPFPITVFRKYPGKKSGYYDLKLLSNSEFSTNVQNTKILKPSIDIIQAISKDKVESSNIDEDEESIEEPSEDDEDTPTISRKEKQKAIDLFHKEKDEFKSPVFVVLNEEQNIVWGVRYSFQSAYELACKNCLHGPANITVVQAEKLVEKNNFVRFWSPQFLNIIASITKVELQ